MSKKSGYKHFSIVQRKQIESFLNIPNITLKTIANTVGYSSKAVHCEIKAHRKIRIRSNQPNKCERQKYCDVHRLCTHCTIGFCKHCRHDNCNQLCNDFIPTPDCKRTNKFPFVCSGCSKIAKCNLPKYFYLSSLAQNEYEYNQSVWKKEPKMTSSQIKEIGTVISSGVKNGQ